MAMGTVTELAGLNSFYELPQNRESNLNALNKFILRQPVYGELIIMVTHYVTIAAITNETVASGEGVLLELREDASYRVVGSLKFDRPESLTKFGRQLNSLVTGKDDRGVRRVFEKLTG
jgi:hypothetical protein